MSFNVRSIKKLNILYPTKSVSDRFCLICVPIIKDIDSNNKEIQKLTTLRDRLLPLLMNGQVEV